MGLKRGRLSSYAGQELNRMHVSRMTTQVRQWPEVYDLRHTFLHVARVRKHTDMRELHAFQKTHGHARTRFACNARIARVSRFDSRDQETQTTIRSGDNKSIQ